MWDLRGEDYFDILSNSGDNSLLTDLNGECSN